MTNTRLLVLFFASGAAALVYEVLWLKELGLLFGATAPAAAATLAVFFLGLSAGAYVWGRRARDLDRPLRTYARMEAGIAATALVYFLLLDLYHAVYAPLFGVVGDRPTLFLGVKLLLSLGVLFPPAFLMGGTLPVLGELMIRRSDQLGRTGTLLYATNTAGAALGAFLAGFYLPAALGFDRSYLLAIGVNVTIAALAWRWDREGMSVPRRKGSPSPPIPSRLPLPPLLVSLLAAASGFLTLALEVLWTRMYAQVLQNSVYTFSAVLTVFLVALGLGSALAHILSRTSLPPPAVLTALLSLAGLAVASAPFLFARQSGGTLDYLHGDVGFAAYVASVFASVGAVLLVPGILIGSVFPYLLKVSEGRSSSAGEVLGSLVSLNTLAAILGSLSAGFLLLNLFGLWSSLRILAAVYLMLAIAVPSSPGGLRAVLAAVPVAGLLALTFLPAYGRLALVHLEEDERLVEVREGSLGTAAVIDRGGDLRIKVDNSYLVGTSASAPNLRLQSWIPLSLHPSPRSVFYLGMGTGITAGAALALPVEKVTVAELNADVVALAHRHFGPYLNGLFEDSRVRLVTEDGRSYLQATRESYDVVIADIFLTYKAGAGALYTREHFAAVRDRLAPGGLFAQWLPMFELTEREVGLVARTMLEVFPQVTVWRRGFSPRFPLLALVGHREEGALDDVALRRNLAALAASGAAPERLWLVGIPYAAYAGNLGQARKLFTPFPVLRDDRPLIEYLSPRVNRDHFGAGKTGVLAFTELGDFCDRLLETAPIRQDPFLAAVPESARDQAYAGLALYKAEAYRRSGRPNEAEAWREEYERRLSTPHLW